ncbi:hypothetical protein SBA1_180024 [Candidatus Sulfotelmatobacter kueseliae]|uniref:Uncharacterized protein n=1 Tax=Candidatus Sulfotelmatobacter kueseliae TaxID=2042962 RepID=A0A2U3KCL6_9BACT|nr:hypothetical protein SBA1_180024 [Candidatus Sulfotelmatobacter kueseliae]
MQLLRMSRTCLTRILHEGKQQARRRTVALVKLSAEPVSGYADFARNRRRTLLHALRPALPHQQQADALEQIHGRVHAFGEEHIRARIMVVDAHLAGDEDGRSVRRHFLDLGDQLRAVESRHGHVGDHQINAALQEAFQRFFSAGEGGYTVASRLQHDFAVGQRLFVIVYTQNCALWFHRPAAIYWERWARRVAKPTEAFLNMKNFESTLHANGKQGSL